MPKYTVLYDDQLLKEFTEEEWKKFKYVSNFEFYLVAFSHSLDSQGNKYKHFRTLEEAKKYADEVGHAEKDVVIGWEYPTEWEYKPKDKYVIAKTYVDYKTAYITKCKFEDAE